MHPLAELHVPKDRVAVHWFGQASYALKTPDGVTALVDPYFPHQRPQEKFIHPEAPLREGELPVQVVFLTHDHSDHTHPETLARIYAASPQAIFVGPRESAARAQAAGIPADRLVVMWADAAFQYRDLQVHFVWAKPEQGDPEADIPAPDTTHLGLVAVSGPVRLYFTGDLIRTAPGLVTGMNALRRQRPEIGFLTCHPTEGEFPDFAGGVALAQRAGLKVAYPSHYDCFVQRTFDPREFARCFAGTGCEARVLGYNQMAILP